MSTSEGDGPRQADARLDGLRQLLEPEGQRLLRSLPPYQPSGELALQTTLRDAGFDPGLVAAALTQAQLRSRAREKFGEFADGMLFTPEGLEQATRLAVAARHAERYLRAEVRLVHDLGCGIGADAMAMAGLDLGVRAVDSDEVTAAVASYNLRFWPNATVEHGRVEDVDLPRGAEVRRAGAWLDPARRRRGMGDAHGRALRVSSLASLVPTWEQVLDVARSVPATGAKLAPGLPHGAVPPGAEAQWTSWDRQVVECAVWWGPLVQSPGRTAAVCHDGRPATVLTEADAADAPPPVSDAAAVHDWLYEPDRAVVRAGLTGALARLVDGAELDTGVGYVTSPHRMEVGWAHRYGVLAVLPWHVKTVRAWLRSRDVGPLTIKKRGVPLDPDQVRRQLHTRGSVEATIVLTRVAGSPYALVVEPA